MRITPSLLIVSATCALACGAEDTKVKEEPLAKEHLVLTCDFLNHSLSVLNADALQEGASRDDALVGEIDLSAYAAGPLDAEVVPGTRIALVSLSGGFFSLPVAGFLIGASSIPTDTGKLLFVDLDSREVVGELDTGEHPMGIAITHDGERAFVMHFGSQDIAVVDVKGRSVLEHVTVGPFSEEVALDETGEVGILAYSAAGNFRTFAAADFAGTLSPDVVLTGDTAGVAFFPGTKTAYVVQAPNAITGDQGGHTVVDVSDPSRPEVTSDADDPTAPSAYPAVPVPSRGTVAVPLVRDSKIRVQEIALNGDGTVRDEQMLDTGVAAALFGAYGITMDAKDRLLMAVPATHEVIVTNLEAGTSFSIPWGMTEAGPTDIVLVP